MDIQEEIPNWKKNLQIQLQSRNGNVNQFGDMLQQLNFYKDLSNQSQKRVTQLENSLRLIKSKKCDDVIKELCDSQLKSSKLLVVEMDLKDKITQLEKELKIKQTKLEKQENDLYDLKIREKRILRELHNTRREVQSTFDDKIVLQLENHCIRTKLDGKDYVAEYDLT